MEEMSIFYDFLAKGIDAEDVGFFHKSYETLLSQDTAQVHINFLLFFKHQPILFSLEDRGVLVE